MPGMNLSPGHHLYDRIDLVVAASDGDGVRMWVVEGRPDPLPLRPDPPDGAAVVAVLRIPSAELIVYAEHIESTIAVAPTSPPSMGVYVVGGDGR